jgi:hypothetical protein
MIKPNIFDIATKELNQDAFITWLLLWGGNNEPETDDEKKLILCGKEFTKALITKKYPNFNEPIETVDAGRQWDNIDVYAKINNKYLIIIEDKTNTGQRSGQLSRYKLIAEEWRKKYAPEYEEVICIYLKTGNETQESLDVVIQDGFEIYNRTDFINLVQQHDIRNDIYSDFKARLLKLESINNEWIDKVINNWNGNDWQGFFQNLEKQNVIDRWFRVNNPNGGFWGALFAWREYNGIPVYLQIEEGKLCFKISTRTADSTNIPENLNKSETRNRFHQLILEAASKQNLSSIRKPDRFGHGNYMTIAIIDAKNWLGDQSKIIHQHQVIENLNLYKSFIDDFVTASNI